MIYNYLKRDYEEQIIALLELYREVKSSYEGLMDASFKIKTLENLVNNEDIKWVLPRSVLKYGFPMLYGFVNAYYLYEVSHIGDEIKHNLVLEGTYGDKHHVLVERAISSYFSNKLINALKNTFLSVGLAVMYVIGGYVASKIDKSDISRRWYVGVNEYKGVVITNKEEYVRNFKDKAYRAEAVFKSDLDIDALFWGGITPLYVFYYLMEDDIYKLDHVVLYKNDKKFMVFYPEGIEMKEENVEITDEVKKDILSQLSDYYKDIKSWVF